MEMEYLARTIAKLSNVVSTRLPFMSGMYTSGPAEDG